MTAFVLQGHIYIYILVLSSAVCVLCIFMYILIHTHACIYFRKICYFYILNIFIYNVNYININIDM